MVRPHINDYEVEILLRTVERTAAGCGNLPAYGYSEIVLLNWFLFYLIFLVCLSQLVNFQDNGCVP